MPKLYTQHERLKRRERYQIAAGMIDFVAILVGIVVLIAGVILLSALVRWVIRDVPTTFARFIEVLEKAIIVPK